MVVSSIGNGGALAAMAVLLVAMAGGTYFRGCIPQGRVKVEPAVSIAVAKVAAYGASRPVVERPNQGPLTEPAADARPQGWGLLFMLRVFGRLPVTDSATRSEGRRPKSLRGGNRGGSLRRQWCRSMGI